MRLLHYTKDPVFMLDRMVVAQKPGMKPKGMWVSVEGEYGWNEWCEEEDFRKENLAHCWEVKLRPDMDMFVWRPSIQKLKGMVVSSRTGEEYEDISNAYIRERGILLLDNESSIDWFNKAYCESAGGLGTAMRWDLLAMYTAGIIISPYQWGKRLDRDKLWYYGWDCASGCIWNPEIIDKVQHYGTSEVRENIESQEHSRKIVLAGDDF